MDNFEIIEVKHEEKIVVNAPETSVQENSGENADCEKTTPDMLSQPLSQVEEHENVELSNFWVVVRKNPDDFSGWIYLLSYVGGNGSVGELRKAFDSFLYKYPYCYGYWKKYADLVSKREDFQAASEIYERGVQQIPLSVDLWVHYIHHLGGRVRTGGLEDAIRAVFERAVGAAGADMCSMKLWNTYIRWEASRDLKRVFLLYTRLLAIPNLDLYDVYPKFRDLCQTHNPFQFLSHELFIDYRSRAVDQVRELKEDVYCITNVPDPVEAPGVEEPDAGVACPGQLASAVSASDPYSKHIRDFILKQYSRVYENTKLEVEKRVKFEKAIRRPYFHVKPLDKNQLNNWREYIKFELKEGSPVSILTLFERCLIACAQYEEFWLEFIRYLESVNTEPSIIRSVYHRACFIHIPRKVNLYVSLAYFEEKNGNSDDALTTLDRCEHNCGGSLVITVTRRAAIERRRGNYKAVVDAYLKGISTSKDVKISTFFYCKLSRFYLYIYKDVDKANEFLFEAIWKDPENERLIMQIIDTEFSRTPIDAAKMGSLFSYIINTDTVPLHLRCLISRRRLEFLEDFGTDLKELEQAYIDDKQLVNLIVDSKRRLDDECGPDGKRMRPMLTVGSIKDANERSRGPVYGPTLRDQS